MRQSENFLFPQRPRFRLENVLSMRHFYVCVRLCGEGGNTVIPKRLARLGTIRIHAFPFYAIFLFSFFLFFFPKSLFARRD